MEAPQAQQIALLIKGNNQSNGGYSVIYSINTPPFDLPAISYGGLNTNNYYFTVRATASYTLFTLVQNHVKSHGAVRAGFLKIGISIPRGYRLSAGTSPHDLLLAIRSQFLDTCMDEVRGEAGTYTYKDQMASAKSFTELLSRFTLEPDPSPLPVMKGTTTTALLLRPEDQMRGILDEVHNSNYTGYYELIIAANGEPVSASPNLPATVIFGADKSESSENKSEGSESESEGSKSESESSKNKAESSESKAEAESEKKKPTTPNAEQPTNGHAIGRRIVTIAIAAVVGLLIGFGISTLINKFSAADDAESRSAATHAVTDSLNNYVRKIYLDENLTFDEIRHIKSWLDSKGIKPNANASNGNASASNGGSDNALTSTESAEFALVVNNYAKFADLLQNTLSQESELKDKGRVLNPLHHAIYERFRDAYNAHPEAAAEAKQVNSFAAMTKFVNKYATDATSNANNANDDDDEGLIDDAEGFNDDAENFIDDAEGFNDGAEDFNDVFYSYFEKEMEKQNLSEAEKKEWLQRIKEDAKLLKGRHKSSKQKQRSQSPKNSQLPPQHHD